MVYRVLASIVYISLFITLIISSCGRKSNKANEGNNEISLSSDSGYLFNGRTLDGWKISNFGTQGPVFVSNGEIILGMGDGCTGISWEGRFPVTNYEVTLEAKRVDGNDFFCGMTFPVGKDPCTLIVGGWGGTVVGLSSVNGSDASDNETTTLMHFEKDHWYKIRLKVTRNTIQAWIDEEMVVDLAIDDKILSIRPEVELSKPFGIASWRTTAALRNIRLIQDL